MKRVLTAVLLAAALLIALAPTGRANDHDLTGLSVQVDNTIEAPAFGIADETPFGSQGPVAVNATIEFAECCDGFYEVDVMGDQISMKWIGDDSFARVIEPGTFDRYYFTFGEPVLAGASVNGASTLPVNLTVVSPTQLTVEVAPGMQVGTGFNALIDIAIIGDAPAPAELAFTGTSTAQLAVIGTVAIAGGMLLVLWSRDPRHALASVRTR